MTKPCFIGVDNGGSATKCAVFDAKGRVLACAVTRIPVFRDGSGRTERDASLIFKMNCQVIREALDSAHVSPDSVACLSLCGYGGGLGMLDSGGEPVAPFVVSTDQRAAALLLKLEQTGAAQAVYERTLQRLWAGQPAVLLPWYKQNQPETLEKCAHIVMIKDYIRYRLTGVIGTEPTDASNTNLFNITDRRFDPKLFEILDIEGLYGSMPDKMFSPCDIAGRITSEAALLTGLREGTPVAAGLYDAASCCLSSGILSENILCLIVGTWSISGHLAKALKECASVSTTLCSFRDDEYFLEESSPTSASNFDWFLEQLMAQDNRDDLYAYCDEAVSGLDPAQCDLVFLPYLYGSNTVPGAKGCLLNLAGHHTRAHILLAVYEGVLFSLLEHVRRLYPTGMPDRARFSGGASRSAVWCRMLANVLNIKVEVMQCEEMGALGAAMCASIASGIYRDYAHAVSEMTHVRRAYLPDPGAAAVYRRKYKAYQKAVEALRLFHQLKEDE